MTIFLILAIYLLIIHLFVPESKKMKKSVWAALGFVLILALRSPYCGLDVTGTKYSISYASYGGVFLCMQNYSFKSIVLKPYLVPGGYETGWLLLTKFISLFTNNLQVYLAIIAVLHFIPIAYIIGQYSKNIVLSYFIFACLGFYVHFFSGIRQMMALSILLLAFNQLLKKHYIWFIIIVLIASTIHRSALFVIIMLPLSFVNLSFINSLLILVLMLLLMPFYGSIVSGLVGFFFDSDYSQYLNEGGQAITMFIVYTILFLATFLQKENSQRIKLLRLYVLVGVACQSLGLLGAGSITRIGYYFNIYFVFLLPEIIDAFKEKSVRIITDFVATILMCIFFTLITTGSSGVIPYKFFWENPAIY